jgi:hypothetical protein
VVGRCLLRRNQPRTQSLAPGSGAVLRLEGSVAPRLPFYDLERRYFVGSGHDCDRVSVRDRLPRGRCGARVPNVRRFLSSLPCVGTLAILTSARAHGSEHATAQIETMGARFDCASAESLIATVEQRLQRRVFVATPNADLRVSVEYTGPASEWAADIDLSTSQGRHLGHRRIASQARQCSSLDDSLALVVALMVDLTRLDVQARAKALPVETSTQVRVPALPEVTQGWAAVLSLNEIATLGQLPRLGFGTELTTDLRRRRAAFSLRIGIAAFLPSSADDRPSSEARFSLYVAELGICTLLAQLPSGEFRLCAGPQIGIERAQGVGYAMSRTTQTTLVQPFAEAESTWWPVPQFGLLFGLGAAMPLIRDRFYATRADGSQVLLFKPWIVAPFLRAGLCLQL